MAVNIESPEGRESLREFLAFPDRVYRYRSARWPATVALQLPVATGQPPFGIGRRFKAFAVREAGELVARVLAMVDDRYNRHWGERLGHLLMFEALPGTREAVRSMMDQACRWLASCGTEAARAGFGLLEFPFVVDDYESLPPSTSRQNPAYYHALLKDAGFETEKGWVDYKIEVTPGLVSRYEDALEQARRKGFEIVAIKELGAEQRARDFAAAWNDAFKAHWGVTLLSAEEIALLFDLFAPLGGLDTSAIAYHADEPVGATMAVRETTELAQLKPGRLLRDSEKLNFLGIGVRESARGRGLNLALASYSYLKFVRAGAKYLSYTLVLDDNWPSRQTGAKLGASVCANYVVYRREFRAR